MKKLTLLLAALVMGFMMISCGGSLKEEMMKEVETYFAQAEETLNEIDNPEDFLSFAEIMSDRSDLLQALDEKFGNKEISEEDMEAFTNWVSERATAYNQKEGAKAAEFLAPALNELEESVDDLYAQFQAGTEFSKESIDTFLDAFAAVYDFVDYDNVPMELQDQYSAIDVKLTEMDSVLTPMIDALYPEE